MCKSVQIVTLWFKMEIYLLEIIYNRVAGELAKENGPTRNYIIL